MSVFLVSPDNTRSLDCSGNGKTDPGNIIVLLCYCFFAGVTFIAWGLVLVDDQSISPEDWVQEDKGRTGIRSLKTWLFVVARNLSLDTIRKCGREKKLRDGIFRNATGVYATTTVDPCPGRKESLVAQDAVVLGVPGPCLVPRAMQDLESATSGPCSNDTDVNMMWGCVGNLTTVLGTDWPVVQAIVQAWNTGPGVDQREGKFTFAGVFLFCSVLVGLFFLASGEKTCVEDPDHGARWARNIVDSACCCRRRRYASLV